MADNNPFAHLGQGMLGSDVGFAQKAMKGSSSSGPLSKLIGKGIDWLADEISGKKQPEGAVPSPDQINPVMAPQPVPPVNYGFSGSLNMSQANAPVAPYSQVEPVNAETAAPTDNSQLTVGGYRKFLRPQGFGTPQQ
jgi:hypothetical protein